MHPSGQQSTIRHGEQAAVLVEVGGGIRSYAVGDRDVLDGYRVDAMVDGARGQPLIPWPNRLHTGRYTWDGVEHTVPMDEPEQQNALHGVTRWRSWTAHRDTEASVRMGLQLLPCPGYPFSLDLSVHYLLDDEGLTVTTRATNLGSEDAPFAAGAHPYLRLSAGRIDGALLQVPAGSWLPPGPSQIPLGRESVLDSPYDFRAPRLIGPLHMDDAFTDLDRDADRRAAVVLSDDQERVELWMDDGYPYVELFTGDTLPDAHRRRQGLGVEPMTCPPDAFRTGEDLVRLQPGGSWSAQWGIHVG